MFLFSCALAAEAHVPVMTPQEGQRDYTHIDEPEVSTAFYGELTGFPHTFVIDETDPFELYVHILVPDIEEATNNISGIIVKEKPVGGVEEVARLHGEEASWESFFEWFSGDSYRSGPEYEAEAGSGVYRIEVSNPDNIGTYALVVGKEEDFSGIGYFETIRRIAKIKEFFGKSQFMVIQSPFVYVPLLIIGVLIVAARLLLKRRKRTRVL